MVTVNENKNMVELKNIDNINSEVSVNFLAELYNVETRTIQNYADPAKENFPLPRIGKGSYNLLSVIRWMHNKLKRKIEILETSGDETLHAERLISLKFKNKREEIALKRDLSKLIDKKITLIAVSNQMSIIASSLEGLKFDLTRDLEAVTDETEKQKIIEKDIDAVRELISTLDVEPYVQSEEKLEELITEAEE